LRAIQSESSSGSNVKSAQIDVATKLQAWKEVAGGKSRGRVYGLADLAANYRKGVSSLTQPSFFASANNFLFQTEREEMAREIIQAKEQARKEEEKAKTVTERCVTADTKLRQMEDDLRMVKEQLAAMMDRNVAMLPLVQVRFTPIMPKMITTTPFPDLHTHSM